MSVKEEPPVGPIQPPLVESHSMNQPEDEPILDKDTEEKIVEKFKTQEHVIKYLLYLFRESFTKICSRHGPINPSMNM